MLKIIHLAYKLLIRDWRAKELYTLIAALVIAVTALTTLNFYMLQMDQALTQGSNTMLGADYILSSQTPIPRAWIKKANMQQLNTALTLVFSTMISAGDQLQLATVKAISNNYPLRGQLHTLPLTLQSDRLASIPPLGTVWVEPQLLSLLQIKNNYKISLGATALLIDRLLTDEPDADSNWFNTSPRVLMNLQDLPATKIIQAGSRVEYRLLLAGSPAQLKTFTDWLKPHLTSKQKLFTAKDNVSILKTVLQRANSFFQLSVIICVILAGIAIAMSARRYCQRHMNNCALLRCFGITQAQIIQLYLSQLLGIGLVSSLAGCCIAFFVQLGLRHFFITWMTIDIAPTTLSPLVFGLCSGLIMLIGFALPEFLALKNIVPLRIFQRDYLTLPKSNILIYLAALFALFTLLVWQTQNALLAAILLYCLLIIGILLYAAGQLLIKLAAAIKGGTHSAWRYGFANLARHARSNSIQLVAFSLVIMITLLISIIRNELMTNWRNQLPTDTPNYFIINIQPNEVHMLQDFLQQQHVSLAGIYPMVRGRLTNLNGKPIQQAVPFAAQNHNALRRELNLTWTDHLPADNKLLSGSWWHAGDSGQKFISIEQRLANDLEIKINDRLTFKIGEQTIDAVVKNIRSVEWGSFHPNFYIIFPPKTLENYPAIYITSIHLTAKQKYVLATLVTQFPNITIIDVDSLLSQIQHLIDKVSSATGILIGFILLAGITVLYASLQSNLEQRNYEAALLRTLGADRKYLQISLAVEFISNGLLAGFCAAIGAWLIARLLAEQIFNLNYSFNFTLGIAGMCSGALLVGLLGLLGTRSVLNQPPLRILQNNL